jgi:hypothetical protein
VDDLPPGGDGGEVGPERVLTFVVDEDVEDALGIVERVGHPGLHVR